MRPAARPSAIVLAMRSASEAWGKRHETSAFERSLSEAGGGVRPFIPIQARKAKKETRKKKGKGRRNADRRVVHDPRFGAARANRSALACRRSTTALAAAKSNQELMRIPNARRARPARAFKKFQEKRFAKPSLHVL
jgi:hypothetical protein